MKPNGELQALQWPYGVEVEAVEGGLLLRPKRKPREGWAEKLAQANDPKADDLREVRAITTEFDEKEWEW